MRYLMIGLVMVVAVVGKTAKADGIDAAETLCAALRYSDDKAACMKIAGTAAYFEEGAVKVCAALRYSDDQIKCLVAIKNKRYTSGGIQACSSMRYSDDIIKCFDGSGRAQTGDASQTKLDRSFVKASLKKALQHLRQVDSRKAEAVIESVLENLD